ncbi:MAG: anhydro-N-acetylmuramic acid kinase [Gemmatimonadota bacterium]|nr:anhydro-N-acetylmuramic acid kinase [Gemmatimonadota bacterium]
MSGDVLIGLMSGTSLDGITAVAVRFTEGDDGRVSPELLGHVARPYDAATRERLAAALEGATPSEYTRLDFALGGWLADAAVAVLAEAGVPRDEVRAICSHGHTVWHEPPHGTWQCGQPAVIAERTGIPAIADFRVRDVAAGGQGAPLVPIADALLFSSPTRWRVLQNLGGIGNLTVVPPGGALEAVRAFDTGPGVCVMDGVTRALWPSLPFDRDGKRAAAGVPIEAVIEALLADPWYAAEPPRSTGRERYTAAFIADVIVRCRAARAGCTDEDIVATATWFTARSIALAFERFVPQPVDEVLLSGGGARNPVLREAIAMVLSPRHVRPFDAVFFDGEAKEAVAFAFLGWLHLRGRAGNVPSATGARGPRVLGAYHPA